MLVKNQKNILKIFIYNWVVITFIFILIDIYFMSDIYLMEKIQHIKSSLYGILKIFLNWTLVPSIASTLGCWVLIKYHKNIFSTAINIIIFLFSLLVFILLFMICFKS